MDLSPDHEVIDFMRKPIIKKLTRSIFVIAGVKTYFRTRQCLPVRY
jgi:hypothetical protein